MKKIFSKKNMIILTVFILLLGVFTGCSDQSNKSDNTKAGYSKISPKEAKNRLDNEEGIIVLDVRTKEEFDSGHIKDAMLIPVDNIKTEADEKLKDKTATIFVYCRSGNRSAVASKALADMGYTNIYDLGGIIDWPYEIVK